MGNISYSDYHSSHAGHSYSTWVILHCQAADCLFLHLSPQRGVSEDQLLRFPSSTIQVSAWMVSQSMSALADRHWLGEAVWVLSVVPSFWPWLSYSVLPIQSTRNTGFSLIHQISDLLLTYTIQKIICILFSERLLESNRKLDGEVFCKKKSIL